MTERRLFWTIFGVALALRAVTWWAGRAEFLFQHPLMDAAYYDSMARDIASGAPQERAYFMSPGYPYLLSGVYAFVGRHLGLVRALQHLLGAAACGWLAVLGARWWDARVGLLSGLMAATYGVSLYYESTLLTATIISGLNLAALWLLTARPTRDVTDVAVRSTGGWPLAAGLCLGYSALCRPNLLLFIAFALIWLARRRDWREGARVAAGVAILVGGMSLRNALVGGGAGTAGSWGMAFWMGNHAGASGTYDPQPFARSDPRFEEPDFSAEARCRSGRDLSAAGAARYWAGEARRFIRESPGAWLALVGRKFALFWHGTELPGNLDYEFVRRRVPWLAGPWLSFGIIGPLALVGLVVARGRSALPTLYLASYFAANLMFFVLSEYRHPAAVAGCWFAAAAVVWGWDRIREGRRAVVVLAGVAALAGMAWAIRPYVLISQETSYLMLGAAYREADRFDDAERAYLEALAVNPRFGPAYVHLGHLATDRGDRKKASAMYRAALQLGQAEAKEFLEGVSR